MSKGVVLLCAGGTGGHLFPAEAVAHEMRDRGYEVHLAADDRVARYSHDFPAKAIHQIRSSSLSAKNPIAIARTALTLFQGYRQSVALLEDIKPLVVAGFGGYPTVPPLFAASRGGYPTLVHEANAVLGRANRLLSRHVDRLAIGFGNTANLNGKVVTVTGNPVRPEVLKKAALGYPLRNTEDEFQLLVFGGSQGASFFSEVLPRACELLPADVISKLRVVQQARKEDADALKQAYDKLGAEAEIAPFFSDMAKYLSNAHLVVSRAGASTVSELAVIGRPAILVPYPHALDHDQAANAATVAAEGGATLFKQAVLTPAVLADELLNAIENPKRLALAAKNAKKTGKPDASSELADILVQLANR